MANLCRDDRPLVVLTVLRRAGAVGETTAGGFCRADGFAFNQNGKGSSQKQKRLALRKHEVRRAPESPLADLWRFR